MSPPNQTPKDTSEMQYELRCSAQRGLLGFVTPNLRCVYMYYLEPSMRLTHFYFDQPPNEDEWEQASMADTEILSDFPDLIPGFNAFIVSAPRTIVGPGWCVYARYEASEANMPPRELILPQKSIIKEAPYPTFCLLQNILLGRITPNFRSVHFISTNPTSVELIFHFDPPPSELDFSLSQAIFADFMKAFPSPQFTAKQQILTNLHPEAMRHKDWIVRCLFARFEAYD